MSFNVSKTLLKAKSLARQGDVDGAAQLFTAVLERFPQNKQAATGLAALNHARPPATRGPIQSLQDELHHLVSLYNRGDLQRALELGQILAYQFPEQPLVHNVVGAVYKSLREYDNAIASLTKAIRLQPDYAEAYNNLGTAYNDVGRHQEAIASYASAIRLNPNFFEAYNNLGNVLKDSHRAEDALANYSRAIEIRPDFAMAHYNLGSVLSELGRYQEGIAACTVALRYQPDFPKALVKLVHQWAQICDWDALQAKATILPDLGLSGEGVVPFELLQIEDKPARHRQRAELFARNTFQGKELPATARPDIQPERLRIGYFSADFRDHATMYLMAKLMELHDREQFVVHAFSYGAGEKESMRSRAMAAVDKFHDVRHLSDRDIAELSRAENIDIAIDLKGYTHQSRLGVFSYRAAPIQISYLGFPGTTGAPFIDYVIADQVVIPKEQRIHYSEQIIYLPHSYQVNDDARIISDAVFSRADAGLPAEGFVFCCFNNNCKIGPAEFAIWMRLLQQVKDSVLWLFSANEWAQENLRKQAKQRGVNPERIIFADRLEHAEHLARQRLADLFLDTFNYNAHTTASDALWAGLPVVTKLGQGFAARVAASLLYAIDLPELIATSASDYERLALDLALNPERLGAIREKLAAHRLTTPLFNTGLFTKHIEAAYRQAYQKYFDGEQPDTILVQP